jgi:hypothetical protein
MACPWRDLQRAECGKTEEGSGKEGSGFSTGKQNAAVFVNKFQFAF